MAQEKSGLDGFFKLSERGTDVKTEIIGGITTFITIAYILAVNPSILADAGMDKTGVFVATALIGFIGTLLMALLTNYPFILAPSMGLNAYFTYTVVITMGYTWQTALAAIFVEGIIFAIISLTPLRDWLLEAIPFNLKMAITAGIGLFITVIGLKGAGLLVSNESTIVAMISWTGSFQAGTFNTAGICAILALIGTFITAILMVRNVPGNILIGILVTWILGIICQFIGLYVPDVEAGYYSLLPDFTSGMDLGALGNVAFQLDFSGLASVGFVVVVIAILFTSVFDTVGTLIGTGKKANLLDEDGKLPNIKGALLAQSLTTMIAGLIGTSPTCVSVECASGIAEGARTGLASIVTAIMFLISLVLSPIFLAIPEFATAPALVIVGFLMMTAVVAVNWDDLTEAIPAFLCLIAMPLFYSIAEGISIGIISYVVINLFAGGDNAKKVNPFMIVLAILFILKYFFI
jgi:AGZA family xanthine/uracil permease-like MFS transporter